MDYISELWNHQKTGSALASHTNTFCISQSTPIRNGQNRSLSTAAREGSRTVGERLLLLQLRNTIRIEKPSMHPCITWPHRIREWCPSKCHREFDHGTEYCLRVITIPHFKTAFAGCTLVNLSRTLLLWTLMISPIDLRNPAKNVPPVVNPWRSWFK